jgi:hypothetical protein
LKRPKENANEVIVAILMTSPLSVRLVFADFGGVLAMFRPEKVGILKIASLLTCSNATGKWLTFEKTPTKHPFAAFDPEMPNCLVVHHEEKTVEKVDNNPILETVDLADDFRKTGKDSNQRFAAHPVKMNLLSSIE